MPSDQATRASGGVPAASFGAFAPAVEYLIDAAERSVLFWDVLGQRGNQYREHLADTTPHVLDYEVELVLDGRTLERPVNYALVRVIPPPRPRSIRRAGPSWWSTHAPGMAPASAASRPTARSG